jgi:hypothetical protein
VNQAALFTAGKPIAPLRNLTERQERIFRLVCESPAGLEPIELGALMHAQSGRHPADEFCRWCGQDGARALRETAIKQRVVRRSTGIYEPRIASDWTGHAETPSAQLRAIPEGADDGTLHYMLTGQPEPKGAAA